MISTKIVKWLEGNLLTGTIDMRKNYVVGVHGSDKDGEVVGDINQCHAF